MDIFILALLAVIALLMIYAGLLEGRLSAIRPTYVVVPPQIEGGGGVAGVLLFVLFVLVLIVVVILFA